MAEKQESQELQKEIAELRDMVKQLQGGKKGTSLRGRFAWDEAEELKFQTPVGIGREPEPPHVYLAQGQRTIYETLSEMSEKLDTVISILKK